MTDSEWNKCKNDSRYFFKNYVYVYDRNGGYNKLSPFSHQLTLFKKFDAGNTISILPRQCGKTTAIAAYALWNILFKSNYKVIMASNKLDMAKYLMNTVMDIYKKLPDFITRDNRLDHKLSNLMSLSNGSSIKFTSFGSSCEMKASTFNLLILDEPAYGVDEILRNFLNCTVPILVASNGKVLIVSSAGRAYTNEKIKGIKRHRHVIFEIYRKAVSKKNSFNVYKKTFRQISSYKIKEHELLEQMGKEYYEKEFLCKFSR